MHMRVLKAPSFCLVSVSLQSINKRAHKHALILKTHTTTTLEQLPQNWESITRNAIIGYSKTNLSKVTRPHTLLTPSSSCAPLC